MVVDPSVKVSRADNSATMHNHKDPLVSVIVPVFNGEKYLRRCLDSVLDQTVRDFELLVIDDGSHDSTPLILQQYVQEDTRVRVITQRNAGQGVARNIALQQARGRYVLFVDADDFIERVTLQVTVRRAEAERSDLVHFDWKFVRAKENHLGRYDYYNTEPFWHQTVLDGEECEQLLRMQSYFSVTNLYRRSFLERHGIRYAEGRIYEDNVFLARVFTLARRASLVHSPLYVIQLNAASSTKVGTETSRHMSDHLAAIEESFAAIAPRSVGARGDLAEYHLEKFSKYYSRRVPRHMRAEYARCFVEVYSRQRLTFPHLRRKISWLTRACLMMHVFDKNRPGLLQLLLEARSLATVPAKSLLAFSRKAKNLLRHPLRTLNDALLLRNPTLKAGSVLFLGFDYRYGGNSRALFEQLLDDERFAGREIRFATLDRSVSSSHRVRPGSLALTRKAARSSLVIAESWVPASIPKHSDSTWIQLWHGTPIKRMLFDSHEREIELARPRHKVNKYNDIQRWDGFVVDGECARERFSTAFLLRQETLIEAPYPQDERLCRQQSDPWEVSQARKRLGIRQLRGEHRVVLYAPTWRDYNYGQKLASSSADHYPDLSRLADLLGKDYLLLVKDHDYLTSPLPDVGSHVVNVTGRDIDDLLLVCDVVITDYSSVVFRAGRLAKPVVLFINDQDRFNHSRGVYTQALQAVSDTTQLAARIRDLEKTEPPPMPKLAGSRHESPGRLLEFLAGRESS